MQMGSMAGFMSHRVLAGFDVGLPVRSAGASYVVPNIASFTTDHGLDIRQARLWMTLHETTHQAEMAVPWVSRHLSDLMAAFVDGLRPDPATLEQRLQAFQDPENLEALLADPAALSGLLAGPESEQVLRRFQAFMSLLEGYAEWLGGGGRPGRSGGVAGSPCPPRPKGGPGGAGRPVCCWGGAAHAWRHRAVAC